MCIRDRSDFEHAAMEVHTSGREVLIQSDILEEVLHKEEKKQLLEAVSQLKGQKKEVILLQYFGDFSQKEICLLYTSFTDTIVGKIFIANNQLPEFLDLFEKMCIRDRHRVYSYGNCLHCSSSMADGKAGKRIKGVKIKT